MASLPQPSSTRSLKPLLLEGTQEREEKLVVVEG